MEIGANGPRYCDGESGFGSKVSRWLGAPQSQTKITDFARGRFAPSASSDGPSMSPAGMAEPSCKKARRPIPAHVDARKEPMSSMRFTQISSAGTTIRQTAGKTSNTHRTPNVAPKPLDPARIGLPKPLKCGDPHHHEHARLLTDDDLPNLSDFSLFTCIYVDSAR